MLVLVLSLLGHAADCEEPVAPTAVAARTDDAMLAWATLDQDGFITIADALPAELACVREVVSPEQAAAVHRVLGLRRFMDGDAEAASAAFRAAAIAEPGYALSERVAPEGGRLWTLYQEAAEERPPLLYPLGVADGFTAWVDGAEGARKAEEVPALVQIGGETVAWTGYLGVGETFVMPELDQAAGGGAPAKSPKAPKPDKVTDSGLQDLDAPAPPSRPDPILLAGLGAGGAAVVLFGASAGLRASGESGGGVVSPGQRSAINGTYLASLGLGAVAGGLVVASVVRSSQGEEE